MSIRKKLMIVLLPSAVILTFGIIFIAVYGWYTHIKKIGTIDAETKDVAFTYTLNGGSANVTSYSVENLSFFDIDNSKETSYLPTMAVKVEIAIKNTTKYTMAYKISYESIHQIKYEHATTYESDTTYYEDEECTTEATGVTADNVTSYYTNATKASEAYCEGLFSESGTLSIKTDTIAKTTMLHEYGSVDSDSAYTLSKDGEKKIYLYLFGVQLVDTARNDDFLDEVYKFILTIDAQNLSEPEVTEVTSTQVITSE